MYTIVSLYGFIFPKKLSAKPRSAQSRRPNTPQRSPQPEDFPTKKPAIIGSQSTAVAVQLTHRPAPKQRPSSRASHQGSVKSRASSIKYVLYLNLLNISPRELKSLSYICYNKVLLVLKVITRLPAS